MRARLGVLCFVVVCWTGARESAACDRDVSPLEAPEVGAVVADLIVTADVITRDDRGATVQIVRALRGGRADLGPGTTLEIGDLGVLKLGDGCSQHPIRIGQRHVFLLWEPRSGERAYRLIDRFGGAPTHSPDVEAAYARAVASPTPHSTWASRNGVATQLVLVPNDRVADGVDLHVVVRNVGKKPITYRYDPRSRAAPSRCALAIVHASTRTRITARPVPIPDNVRAYLARRIPDVVPLPRGAAHVLTLQQVTTPTQTPSHRAELGFVYYPPVMAGEHVIRATCRNLRGPGTRLTTAPLRAKL